MKFRSMPHGSATSSWDTYSARICEVECPDQPGHGIHAAISSPIRAPSMTELRRQPAQACSCGHQVAADRSGRAASPLADQVLQSDYRVTLLRSWVHVVMVSRTSFGDYCRAFANGGFPLLPGRARDVLPLPVATAGDLCDWYPTIGFSLGLDLLQLVCAGLNYLFMDGGFHAVPRTSSATHRAVFSRIACLLEQITGELDGASQTSGGGGAFSRLTSRGSADKYPPLRAHDVDLLPHSATLDPLPWLPASARAVLCNPDELFPGGVSHLGGARTSREVNHGDHISLLIRSLRSGKVGLAIRAKSSADTFVVGKHGSSKLREVWNGALLTDAALAAPKPWLQANPASLGSLECTDDDPFLVSCRDGRAFFDQLKAPHQLRPYFGRAQVLVSDLLQPPPCESGGLAADALALAEVGTYLIDGTVSQIGSHLTPVNLCFPMGFGWSSFVAQQTMVASVLRAGFDISELLSAERLLLPGADRAVAVATDDVHLFERQHALPGGLGFSSLDVLDQEWDSCGLIGHTDKRVDSQPDARVLGMEFRDGKRFQARGTKVAALLEAALDLTSIGSCTPAEMTVLNGHLQWQNLINRPMYACLDAIYPFVHLQPDTVRRAVPEQVLSEVLLNLSLCCFWSADLCRPWWCDLPATDASPSFGYGLSVARCSQDLVRDVAAISSDPVHYLRLLRQDSDPTELPRAGTEYRLPLSMDHFKDVFAIRAKVATHSGAMEMHAVQVALLRLTRSRRRHRCRGVVLVDATAVAGALAKGRSSSTTLKRGTRAIAAIALSCELRLHFPYLPSESNPADFPSRGKVRRRTVRRPSHFVIKQTKLDLQMKAYRRAYRRARDCDNLDTDSSFSGWASWASAWRA